MATTIFEAYSEIMEKKRLQSIKVQEQLQPLEFYCSNCKSKLAAIFQTDGDFCTECWQAITHPNIECSSGE
jgi:hypothetical protein